MKEKIKTYIEGLDEQMTGGIPKGHVVLLSGMPGTMKSSIAYNILFNNARERGIKGLYISLEQGRDSLLDQMFGLGMDHNEVEEGVNVVDMGYLRMHMPHSGESQDWMKIFRMYVENLKASMKYEILIVDSLPVLEMLSAMESRRTDLFELFGWLKEMEITTFIIAEAATDINIVHEEDFLADGIIKLIKERMGTDVQRQIMVDKMRGVKHSTGLYTLMHDGENFRITKVIGD
ncbi:MAG: AAA family ATPase [Euryarchaeota archaeon]|nr:AAA family ATPase [Euryarchaeota archaeon]